MDAAVEEAIRRFKDASPRFTQLYNRIMKSGKNISYDDAFDMGNELARIYSRAMDSTVPRSAERLAWQQAHDLVGTTMSQLYQETAWYAAQCQRSLNQTAGVSLKAAVPGMDPTQVSNLEEKLISEDLDEVDWLFGDRTTEAVARKAVNETIEVNAAFQSEAGLQAIVERIPGPGGCCDWCMSMAGRYVMGQQPDDFWRVHDDCTCKIVYKPSKRSAWSRISYKTTTTKTDEGKIQKSIEKITEFI